MYDIPFTTSEILFFAHVFQMTRKSWTIHTFWVRNGSIGAAVVALYTHGGDVRLTLVLAIVAGIAANAVIQGVLACKEMEDTTIQVLVFSCLKLPHE